MKKILLTLILIAFGYSVSLSQAPTRHQLLQLYHQANTAKNKGDYPTAISKYEEIIGLVPKLSDPYLYLAQIYEAQSEGNVDNLETAIMLYRKYIDIELDDSKTAEPMRKLKILEARANTIHYEEILLAEQKATQEEYALMEKEIAQEEKAEKEEVVPIVVPTPTPKTEPEPVVVEQQPEEQETTPIVPVVDVKKTVESTLPFPIEIDAKRVKSVVTKPITITPNKLVGRWVSQSRFSDGREVWILDISQDNNELVVSINQNSGVFSVPQWKSGGMNERQTLQEAATSQEVITTNDDITYGTMRMFENLNSKTATGEIGKNKLSFGYTIEYHYKATAGKRDKFKFISEGLSMISQIFGGDVQKYATGLSNVVDKSVASAEAQDTPLSYVANIDFDLSLSESGMNGTIREVFTEKDGKTQRETKNRIFATTFYKVDGNYEGQEAITYFKDEKTINEEREILDAVKDDAKVHTSSKYLVAILELYGVGKESKDNSAKPKLKNMLKAAKNGSIDAMEYIVRNGYVNALNENLSKSDRKKQLDLAEEWRIKAINVIPADIKCAEANYYIQKGEYDKARTLLSEATKYKSANACCKLGKLCLENFNNPQEAFKCFDAAINMNSSDAMLEMAKLYRDGKGVKEDASQYISWVIKAYEAGNVEALKELSDAYYQGIGVAQDINRGNEYLNLYYKRTNDYWKEIVKKFNPNLLNTI